MAAKRSGETSYRETAFGVVPRSKLIPLEIEGIKRAWDFVIRFRGKRQIPLTSSFIKKLHGIGFGWIFPEFGGIFRNVEVTVSKHIPPKPYEVPVMMENFFADLKTRLHYLPKVISPSFSDSLVVLLGWAHHRFLWIHPFKDYNGRIGRLLINIILLNLDLPPAELYVETTRSRKKYIAALQSADQGDFKPLEKIIRVALEEASAKF